MAAHPRPAIRLSGAGDCPGTLRGAPIADRVPPQGQAQHLRNLCQRNARDGAPAGARRPGRDRRCHSVVSRGIGAAGRLHGAPDPAARLLPPLPVPRPRGGARSRHSALPSKLSWGCCWPISCRARRARLCWARTKRNCAPRRAIMPVPRKWKHWPPPCRAREPSSIRRRAWLPSRCGPPARLPDCWLPGSPPDEIANLGEHRDSLGAVATLAAAALETLRDVERLRAENSLLRERLGVGRDRHRRREHRHSQNARADCARGAAGHLGAHPGRNRRRQGAGGPRPAPPQPSRGQALRRHQLRRTHRNAAGKRVVRTREGRLHRSRGAEKGQARDGRGRHGLSRRDRRAGSATTGQAAARSCSSASSSV